MNHTAGTLRQRSICQLPPKGNSLIHISFSPRSSSEKSHPRRVDRAGAMFLGRVMAEEKIAQF
jgi:hypothetical protein